MPRLDPRRIRTARLAKFWTQGDLATHSSLTSQTIHRLETGKTYTARMSTIRHLAAALDVDPIDLVVA